MVSRESNRTGKTILIVLFVLAFAGGVRAQEGQPALSGDQAVALFNRGEYSSAMPHFQSLMRRYPADPLYKYYTAVCMVKLGTQGEEASQILRDAIRGSSALREVPADSWFYLGRAYQIGGKYDLAIESYDRFRELVRKRDWKEYNVEKYIDECSMVPGTQQAAIRNEADDPGIEEIGGESSLQLADTNLVLPQSTDTINATYVAAESEKPPASYERAADQALRYQGVADSLTLLADRFRESYRRLTGPDRESIAARILSLEELILVNQSLADSCFNAAAEESRSIYEGPGAGKPAEVVNQNLPAKDTSQSNPALVAGERSGQPPDSAEVKVDSLIVEEAVAIPVTRLFSTSAGKEGEIPVNDTLPEGLTYRIQIAAFRNPVRPDYFKDLGPLFGMRAEGSDITFYYVGLFRKITDANDAIREVNLKGFNDAFVVASAEGKRVSFERAAQLEKVWGEKSLGGREVAAPLARSNEPATLVFRVEAAHSPKKLKPAEIENLRLVAGNREFLERVNQKGEYVYLIGKFITFESAVAYSDLLFRNGIKEARVAAYLGDREIPVEEAIKLFNLEK